MYVLTVTFHYICHHVQVIPLKIYLQVSRHNTYLTNNLVLCFNCFHYLYIHFDQPNYEYFINFVPNQIQVCFFSSIGRGWDSRYEHITVIIDCAFMTFHYTSCYVGRWNLWCPVIVLLSEIYDVLFCLYCICPAYCPSVRKLKILLAM